MGLQRYQANRRFVVQKHAAATLHYDFRLEVDGVLKSWAVTQEPTEDIAVKRLAVRTEDHPLEHAVDAWDQGTWIPEEAPLASLRRGKLKFELKGQRMKGQWTLIRMGNASTGKKDLWLLMKVEDGARAARRP